METAVHIFAGFLDSGKTTALQGTLLRKEDVAKRSVVICTEEGEEEYDIDALKDRFIIRKSYISNLTECGILRHL